MSTGRIAQATVSLSCGTYIDRYWDICPSLVCGLTGCYIRYYSCIKSRVSSGSVTKNFNYFLSSVRLYENYNFASGRYRNSRQVKAFSDNTSSITAYSNNSVTATHYIALDNSNRYFSNNITGVTLTGSRPCSNCKFLGYGLISKLNEQDKKQLYLQYSSNVSSGKTGNCEYYIEPKIIKNEKLDIEFRSVDVNNPFPGKNGSHRTPGTNWNDSTIISSTLQRRANSYGIIPNTGRSATAKYTIVLSPKDIEEIRNYNRTNNYDDYNFTCNASGENCTSRFLTELRSGRVGGRSISNRLVVH